MKQPGTLDVALLRRGVEAAKAGQSVWARQLLFQVIELDEANLQAWLWLSSVVADPLEKFICLKNVLKLDPDNKPAQLGLARLEQQAARPRPPPASQTAPSSPKPPRKSSKIRRLKPSLKKQTTPDNKTKTSCPFCIHPISLTVTICPHCQFPLAMACPACGIGVDVERRTCSACNQSMGDYRRRLIYFAGLATAYQGHKQPRQALAAWLVVERLDPDYPQLRLHLGQAQAAVGQTEAAVANLHQALTQDPDQAAASLALGKILHRRQRWDEAQQVYKEALVHAPKSAELHFAFGLLQIDRGRAREALSQIRKVTRLDPKNGLAWWRLGQLYEVFYKSGQATRAYQQAASLLPSNTVAALKARQRLIALNPALPEVMAGSWAELVRQVAGPVLICVLAALFDAGLHPWWIPWSGWAALLLGGLGAFLWATGSMLPYNPLIRLIVGKQGVSSPSWRTSLAVFGGFCWLLGLGIIFYPLGQAYPEVPEWLLTP